MDFMDFTDFGIWSLVYVRGSQQAKQLRPGNSPLSNVQIRLCHIITVFFCERLPSVTIRRKRLQQHLTISTNFFLSGSTDTLLQPP